MSSTASTTATTTAAAAMSQGRNLFTLDNGANVPDLCRDCLFARTGDATVRRTARAGPVCLYRPIAIARTSVLALDNTSSRGQPPIHGGARTGSAPGTS